MSRPLRGLSSPMDARYASLLSRLDTRIDAALSLPGASMPFCREIIDDVYALLGSFGRAIELGVSFTPIHAACIARIVRRRLNKHRRLAAIVGAA